MYRKAVATSGMLLVLAALMLCMIAHDAEAGRERLLPRFEDSAIQGFDSRMRDSAVQRFESPMRNSRMQRFESRMLSSPVSRFESRMTHSVIQDFESQMMYSPAQRVEPPTKPFRPLTFFFAPIHGRIPASMHEEDHLPPIAPRPTASPIFISLRCGAFTQITIGKSDTLSEKEEAPCADSEEDLTDRDATNDLDGRRF